MLEVVCSLCHKDLLETLCSKKEKSIALKSKGEGKHNGRIRRHSASSCGAQMGLLLLLFIRSCL